MQWNVPQRNCFVPDDFFYDLLRSNNSADVQLGVENIPIANAVRASRRVASVLQVSPQGFAPAFAPVGHRERRVCDMRGALFPLPGDPVRVEGDPPTADDAVNEAYDHAGKTYDCYQEVFGRNSLDDRGLTLVSSVHYGRNVVNAFWDGEQMLYGDGDGRLFLQFTKALDVVAHELTHGVVQYTCNLVYRDESGALNEHFADAMSAVVKQWANKQDVTQADWLMGDALMAPGSAIKSIRTFKPGKAYPGDKQAKHMREKYTGTDDRGGVHTNSGIPNLAFYLVATGLGGNVWDKAGGIWYNAMLALLPNSRFADARRTTLAAASNLYGVAEAAVVQAAWDAVGVY